MACHSQDYHTQVLSIFDSLDFLVYVSDIDSGEILYANPSIQRVFNQDLIGEICYRAFHGFDQPCQFCTNEIICGLNYAPYKWNFHNQKLNRDFQLTDRLIKWSDGRDVRLEVAVDISRQNLLANREERLNLALTAAEHGIWDWDLIKGEVEFDERYYSMAGYQPGDFPARFEEWEQRIYSNDLSEVRHRLEDHLCGNSDNFDVEFRFRRADNSWMWIRSRGKIVQRNDAGKPMRFVGIHQDITERRQAQQRLRETEARNRAILSSIPDLMFVNDDQGIYLDYNAADKSLLAVNPEEFIGKPISAVLPWSLASQFIKAFENSRKSGQTQIIEYELPLPTGTHYFEARVSLMENHNFLTIVRDVTERQRAKIILKESEARFHSLFDSMKEVVILGELVMKSADEAVDYCIIDCNQAFEQISKISGDLVRGKLGSEYFNQTPPPFLDKCREVAINGQIFEDFVYYEPLNKFLQVSLVSPVTGRFAVVITDVTELNLVNEELNRRNDELESFMYIATHDLRSPLVNIQGFSFRLRRQIERISELLKEVHSSSTEVDPIRRLIDETLDEKIPLSLDFISNNINRMDGLINGMLKVARTGSYQLNYQTINMDQLMAEIFKSMSYQIMENQVEISSDSLPECLGDCELLRQLFSNLIGNSIKYRDLQRPLKISLSGQIKHFRVIYQLSDNGRGIGREHFEKIWEMFYRVDKSDSLTGEGLGLCLVKKIVDKHRGSIWLESKENFGSTFFIELPAASDNLL